MKLFLIINLLVVTFGYSHDQRLDIPKDESAKPYSKITSDKFSAVKSNMKIELNERSISDVTGKTISMIEELLNDYYSQFKKNDDDDQNPGSFKDKKNRELVSERFKNYSSRLNPGSDSNSVRLFIDEVRATKAETYLIRDSEILYELHRNLAYLYNKKKDRDKTLEFYHSALRYKNFSQTEDSYIDENSWKEIEICRSSEELNKRQIHKRNKEDIKKLKEELKSSEDDVYIIDAKYTRGKISKEDRDKDIETAKKKIEEIKISLNERENAYKESRKAFEDFEIIKAEEDSKFLIEYAKAIKEIENEIKDRVRINNSMIKNLFPPSSTARNSDFYSYEQILELGYKVNPRSAEIVKLIADENKSAGKKNKALDYYNKYIQLISNQPGTPPEELYEVYLSLGILYSDLKKNVQAAEYYNKAAQVNINKESKKDLYYHLGNFYRQKTGDVEKSKEYYELWLEARGENKFDTESEYQQYIEDIKQKFYANFGISLYYKFLKKPEPKDIKDTNDKNNERYYLLKSYSFHREIFEYQKEEEKKLVSFKKELDEAKIQLANNSTNETLQKYRDAEGKTEKQKIKVNDIRIGYSAFRKTAIIFRLIELEENNRDFIQAKKYYEEIVSIGSENEIQVAILNIQRINKIMEDGVMRPRILY